MDLDTVHVKWTIYIIYAVSLTFMKEIKSQTFVTLLH